MKKAVNNVNSRQTGSLQGPSNGKENHIRIPKLYTIDH